MLTVIDGVDIDGRAIIPCPLLGFKNRRALNCAKCENYRGLAQMRADGEWSDRYAIRCAHIMERRTQTLEIIED